MKIACILQGKSYAPGDLAPTGYLAWHEWAGIQAKAGLKQVECGRCGRWKFPQELSDDTDSSTLQSRKGPVAFVTPVCIECKQRAADAHGKGAT